MLSQMPLGLYTRWRRYDELEPINPYPRLEWMLAQLTAFTYAPYRPQDHKALAPDDFLPAPRKAEPEMNSEDKLKVLKFWALGEKIKMGAYEPPGGK